MVCQSVSGTLICTFLYISIIYTTFKTVVIENTTYNSGNITSTNRDIILCNKTAVVYLEGMPVYTIIGNGCKSIAKLARFYIISNNTVFFWHIKNTSVVTMFFKEQKEQKGFDITILRLLVLTILFIRKLFFAEAE